MCCRPSAMRCAARSGNRRLPPPRNGRAARHGRRPAGHRQRLPRRGPGRRGPAARGGIVITGRVADPSLTVGPCIAHFGWQPDDYDRIAGATVAGHLIECGTQVTGGISTDWLELPDPADIGFPIVEVSRRRLLRRHQAARHRRPGDERTVKEQLLYEIGDPGNYLSPDATVSFLSLRVERRGRRPRARQPARPAARRRQPTRSARRTAPAIGRRHADDLRPRRGRQGPAVRRDRPATAARRRAASPQRSLVECLGAGDVAPGVRHAAGAGAARDRPAHQRRPTTGGKWSSGSPARSRRWSPAARRAPPATPRAGRPVREVFGYWPTLIDRATPCGRWSKSFGV